MSKFIIKTSYDEESFTVWLNDIQVGRANHDDNGWKGMEDVEGIVAAIAKVLDIPVDFEQEEE